MDNLPKNATELAQKVRVKEFGELIMSLDEAAALIQSSFEAWKEGAYNLAIDEFLEWLELDSCGFAEVNISSLEDVREGLLDGIHRRLHASRQSASEPSGEEAFAQAVGEVLRKEHAFDNDEVIEVLIGTSALLASLLASHPAPTDEKALREALRTTAEKLRQFLPQCGKQDMTNRDRDLVEWLEGDVAKLLSH